MRSFAAVVLVWAAIYLPALGSLEIKGEEGRRILPAVRMIETHDYLVPKVGSEPYLRKPPLINWLVAGSFKMFGQRNEWTARLPSALCLLAAALVFVAVSPASLGLAGSTIAALVWLTNFGLIEKGRLIEIEALYASLFAIAFVCWLSWWEAKRSPWLTWIVPWIFLGLGWLAKGPLHLLFFYAVVIAVLWRAGELRALWSFPHLLGIILMLSIFAAWAIPFAQVTGGGHTTHVWSKQFSGRVAPDKFDLAGWATNIPRSLNYLLPWLIFAPLLFVRLRLTPLQRALTWAIALTLVAVDLVPGSLPRYTMPLTAPFAWLIASVLVAEKVEWRNWLGGKPFSRETRLRISLGIVVAACLCLCVYALAIVPRLQSRQKIRTIATQIEDAVPRSERLFAVDPDYQPFLFYVRRNIVYVSRVEDLPADTHYFMVQPANEMAAESAPQWSPGSARRVLSIKDYRGSKVVLFATVAPSAE